MSVDRRTLETATYQAMGRNLKVCTAIRDHLVLSGHIDRLKMVGYIQEYKMFLKNSTSGNLDTQRVALQWMLKCVSQGTQEQQQAYFRTALVRRFRFELERNQWFLTMVGSVEAWAHKQLAAGQPEPICLTAALPRDLCHHLQRETRVNQPLTALCRLLREHCNLNTDAEYRRHAFCLYLESAGAATYDELAAIQQAPLTYFPNRVYPHNEARGLLNAALRMPPPKPVIPEALSSRGNVKRADPVHSLSVATRMPPNGPVAPAISHQADDDDQVYEPLHDVRDMLFDSFWEAVPKLARQAEEDKKAKLAVKQTGATQKTDVDASPEGYTMGAAWGPVPDAALEGYTMGAAWGPVNQASEKFSYGFETTSTDVTGANWQSKRADQTVLSSGRPRDMARRIIAPVTESIVNLATLETFGNNMSSAGKSRKRRHDDECRETNDHVNMFSRETAFPAKRQKIMDDLEEKRRRVTSWLREEFQGLKKSSSSRKSSGVRRHIAVSSAKSATARLSEKTSRNSSTWSSGQVLGKNGRLAC